jgi:zinc protease
VGIRRADQDYFPILIMNSIFGGQFSSRLNLNLREDKGYTYGASSAFQTGVNPGAFLATAGVQTAVTKESVVEFMRELNEIRGQRPITQQELDFAKTSLIRGEALLVETNAQILARLQNLALFGLPLDYYDHFTERLAAVTLADVNRVARDYLHPDKIAVVVVGDRAAIETQLKTLPYPIEVITVE